MKRIRMFLFFLLAVLLPGTVLAAPDIRVVDGWVRAMPPVAKNSAGYLVIENHGEHDDVLLGASVDGARLTELHEMVSTGATMAMRRRQDVAVAAGSSVVLAPGGLHLMLIGLQRPLVAGEQREAVLRFRDAGEQRVILDVRAP